MSAAADGDGDRAPAGDEWRALADTLTTVLPSALPRFLRDRRWFAGKARTIRAAVVEDLAMLPAALERGDASPAAPPVALAVVRVEYVEGDPERYALLLAVVIDAARLPAIATIDGAGGRVVVEAAAAPFAVRALARGFVAAADGRATATIATARGGRLVYGDVARGAVAADALALDRIRPLDAEQSNSSIRLGPSLLLKLIRVVGDGENPDVEVGRVLTAVGFRATAALRGALSHLPAAGSVRTIGVLQEWRDNLGDGWSYVVAMLRELAAGKGDAAALRRDARALADTTADLHTALASDAGGLAFTPEPVSAADVVGWTEALRARAARLWPRLRGNVALATRARATIARLGDAPAQLFALVSAPALTTAFVKIRIHGDYHLGQTLRVPDGFLVIDFEGEPARPLAERRAKHCALKDVAGMLRSFAYASAVAGAAAGADVGTDAGAVRDAAPEPGEMILREAFLAGYFERVGDARFVPGDAAARRAWIDLFELEKALYEVEYELDHRPDWIEIPLRGVERLVRRGG